MSYRVNLQKSAAKQLKKLPIREQQRIGQKLQGLEQTPRPRDCKKLIGEDNLYRVRVGTYPIIYSVKDAELIVLVIRIGHRGSIYQ